jgi:hypothetical protein
MTRKHPIGTTPVREKTLRRMNERRSPGESTALELVSITVSLRVVQQLAPPVSRRPRPCYENRKRSSSALPAGVLGFAGLGIAGWLLTSGFGCAGSHAEADRPVPSLASSEAAQRDFRSVEQRWVSSAPSARAALEPSLRAFLAAHPEDGRAPLVRVYLALVLMDQRHFEAARAALVPLATAPAGTTRDYAELARAALWLAEGKASSSRLELEELRGKLIGAEERMLYGELLVRSALAEDHLAEAVLDMRWWLNDVQATDVPEVKLRVLGYIARFESDELEEAREWLRRDKGTSAAGLASDAWLEQELLRHLVQSAVRDNDAALARRLLKTQLASALGDVATRDALARLASGGELARRVVGRTVGLVLSLGSPEARVRSSELAAGVTLALGLPESENDPEAVRLLVKDDRDGMRAALGALAGEGASILIAGVDAASGDEAVKFAEEAAIPVMTVASVQRSETEWEYAFSLGEPLATQRSVLEAALRREGLRRWVEVGPDPGSASCANQVDIAGTSRFPVGEWRRAGIDALVLLGDERCSQDVIDETRRSGQVLDFALGLESAGLALDPSTRGRVLFVRAGAFPGELVPSTEDMPSAWYEALGQDAAALAKRALAPFPSETVDDALIVAELHTRARDRLLSTTVKLRTSHQDGFAGQHRLPRELRPAVRAASKGP